MQNIRRSISAIAVCVLWSATGSHAQSLPLSFGADGRLGAGYTDQVSGAGVFFFGDATSRVSLNNTPLGFELGLYGLANAADTPHETYGTFTWDFTQGGKLLVGVTRPAYDSFAVSAFDALLPSLGVANTGTTRSQATYGAMFAGFLPYGVRYETSTDKLRCAASIATVPNRDTTIAGFGLAFPIGQVTFESAVEVSWGTTVDVAGKLQVKGAIGRVNTGLGLYLPGTVGGPETAEVFASFAPADKTTVAAEIQMPLNGVGDPTIGISARYDFSQASGFSIGVLSNAGAEAAYSAYVDWSF
jgi:hypothetical protein